MPNWREYYDVLANLDHPKFKVYKYRSQVRGLPKPENKDPSKVKGETVSMTVIDDPITKQFEDHASRRYQILVSSAIRRVYERLAEAGADRNVGISLVSDPLNFGTRISGTGYTETEERYSYDERI